MTQGRCIRREKKSSWFEERKSPRNECDRDDRLVERGGRSVGNGPIANELGSLEIFSMKVSHRKGLTGQIIIEGDVTVS